MNTKIEYLYRDASNYKVWNECVIQGELTEKQKKTILDALDSGEYFIPSQVGLPEQRFDDETEDDHCWFEMGEYAFSQTNAPATVQISAEELARALARSKNNWQDGVCFGPDRKIPLLDQVHAVRGRPKEQGSAPLAKGKEHESR